MSASVQRVSKRFAAENRTIGSADMSGSRYVPTTVVLGVELQPWQIEVLDRALCGWLDQWRDAAKAIVDAASPLIAAGVIQPPLPTEPRARALAAKQRRGHGPPPANCWRGRERTLKYKSQP